MTTLNLASFRVIKPTCIHMQKQETKQQFQKLKTREVVLKVITDNPGITTQEIVKLTEFAASTVYRVTAKLEDLNLIARNDNCGYGNTYFSAI